MDPYEDYGRYWHWTDCLPWYLRVDWHPVTNATERSIWVAIKARIFRTRAQKMGGFATDEITEE